MILTFFEDGFNRTSRSSVMLLLTKQGADIDDGCNGLSSMLYNRIIIQVWRFFPLKRGGKLIV